MARNKNPFNPFNPFRVTHPAHDFLWVGLGISLITVGIYCLMRFVTDWNEQTANNADAVLMVGIILSGACCIMALAKR